jgi:hypothetical protein
MAGLIRIEPFAGACDGSVETFIKKVEAHCKYSLPDTPAEELHDVKVWVLAENLKDNAREWYDSQPMDTRTTLEALLPALRDKFQARDDPDRHIEILLKLEKLKQGTRPVEEYLQEARKLFDQYQRGSLPENSERKTWALRKTLEGLSSPEIRMQTSMQLKTLSMMGRPSTSFDDLAGLIRTAQLGMTPLGQLTEPHVYKPSEREADTPEERLHKMMTVNTQQLIEGFGATFSPLIKTMMQQNVAVQAQQQRPTYPPNAGQQQRGNVRPAGPFGGPDQTGNRPYFNRQNSPCLNCYEMGHFKLECDKKIPLQEKIRRREEYEKTNGANSLPQMSAMMPTNNSRVPVGAASMVHDTWLEEEGCQAVEDGSSTGASTSEDVICFEGQDDIPWDDLAPEIVAAVKGNEAVSSEDEDYIYGEIMAARKRTRTNAQLSSNDDMATRARPAPEPKEKPKSIPVPPPFSFGQPPAQPEPLRKQKRAPRGTLPYRHTRMMQDGEPYDVVARIRTMNVREEDNLTWGQILDMSPAWTHALAKSFVRPRRRTATEDASQTARQTHPPVVGPSRSRQPSGARRQATVESHGESAVVQPAYTYAIEASDVKEYLTSDLAQYVNEGRRNRILKSCYTVGSVLTQAGKRFTLKRVLFDCGSTLDLINEGIAKTLGLEIIPTKPRSLSVADGYQVVVTGRTWVTLTLEGKVTKNIPVLVMTGDTPYSLLLGTWGLFVFHAEAAFHPLPAVWTISDKAGGPKVTVTRDNIRELEAEVREAVQAARRRRETHPLQEVVSSSLTRKTVRFDATAVEAETETSGTESEDMFIELTNRLAMRILEEGESSGTDMGYDTDMSDSQTTSSYYSSSTQGNDFRS